MELMRMSNIELLELYSKYNKLDYRTNEEQEIVLSIRAEILRRMEKN